jgi:exopolyphosphatase/guanosine-5'-triphosphate,3'-diphosphate pyrophosphatase
MEKFMKKDPIPQSEIGKMEQYFREVLLPLTNAVHQYQPTVLIGSSGSFDTLNDMFYCKTTGDFPPENIAGFDYTMAEFGRAYEQLIFSTREERMKIAGMKELRVDMIVVAMVLIKFLLQTFGIQKIKISNYALKEGAMKRVL